MNPNDPAFSTEVWHPDGYPKLDDVRLKGECRGLTKREWLAGMAMQAIMNWRSHPDVPITDTLKGAPEIQAREACRMADALIAELNKGESNASPK